MKRKIAEMDKKNYRIRLRKQFACPPNLKILLERMNLLEPELTLWAFNEALNIIRNEKPNLDAYDALQEAFRMCLRDLPIRLQNFVNYGVLTLPKDESEIWKFVSFDVLTDINNRISRYEDFRLSRLKLSRLAFLYERDSKRDLGAEYAIRSN